MSSPPVHCRRARPFAFQRHWPACKRYSQLSCRPPVPYHPDIATCRSGPLQSCLSALKVYLIPAKAKDLVHPRTREHQRLDGRHHIGRAIKIIECANQPFDLTGCQYSFTRLLQIPLHVPAGVLISGPQFPKFARTKQLGKYGEGSVGGYRR